MLKELGRFIDEDETQQTEDIKLTELIQKCRGLRFYKWRQDGAASIPNHDTTRFIQWVPSSSNGYKYSCDWNHLVPGLPLKNGVPLPLFDYEREIVKALLNPAYLNSHANTQPTADTLVERNHQKQIRQDGKIGVYSQSKTKHIGILKAAGLGITELILRFMLWLCMKDDQLRGSQMIIFTGPRLELSVSLVQRMRDMFKHHGIIFNTKETVIEINGVRIEAFPSHHSSTARGLPNVSFIFVDEASFIPDREAAEVYDIMMRYIPKSNPFIVCTSTPQKPGDMLYNIMKEPLSSSPLKKLYLDWTYGVGKIYSQDEIDKIRHSRSFPREYCLQFTGVEGNVFSQLSIDNCIKLGEKYGGTEPFYNVPTVIGIDPGFGSSNFGIVVTQYVNDTIVVTHCEEIHRPNFTDVIDKILQLKRTYGHISNIIVDSANPEIIQALKVQFNEPYNEQYIRDKISYCKTNNLHIETQMKVVPRSFAVDGKSMLQHLSSLLDQNLIAIPSRYEDLINGLRSSVAVEWKLDKEQTPFNDLVDALRLNTSYYKMGK